MENRDNGKSRSRPPPEEGTPVNPILTQLVQEGFLPEIVFDVIEEFLLLMRGQVIWHDARGQVIGNIGKLRGLS